MRYDIRLKISYDYGVPSDHARTLVRLLPSDLPGQQLVTARLLSVDPIPGERREAQDFFGNAMASLAFHRPIDRIELSLAARVERLAPPMGLDLAPDLLNLSCEIAGQADLSASAPHHYRGPSPRVPFDRAITAFAREVTAQASTAIEVVECLGTALNTELHFDADATDVDTPPAEAFANRHGVCQDFSQIMIGGLRVLGVPAGYVSGFLRTIPPEGQPRLEGADAMHAWVRAWCGADVGWVEYDPTNACRVGTDHIVVAYGRDYADVAPVKGSLRTFGPQKTRHSVDVIPL